MAKKNWFSLLKRFFTSNPKKKGRNRRWVFTKLKIRQLAPLSATSPLKERPRSEDAEEEQRSDGADLLQPTSSPRSSHDCDDEKRAISAVETWPDEDLAATKIQTAFRGYLARKALRALKGLVRLQAIIRGRAVRRQAIATLKRLQSVVNIQSQICAQRCGTSDRTSNFQSDFRGKDIKIDSNSQRKWDHSILTKEEEHAMFSSKREAAIKRERIKEYAFNRRMSTETEQNKANGRWRYWLDKWVETRLTKGEDLHDPKTLFSSQAKNNEEFVDKNSKSTKFQKQYLIDGLNSPLKVPRRSFHRNQTSIEDNNSSPRVPIVPTYMAATESARAKSRSLSSPRLRPVNLLDYNSDSNSPYKSPMSRRIGNPSNGGSSQKSPSLKDFRGPIKSNGPLKDLSVDSLFSLQNWNVSLR